MALIKLEGREITIEDEIAKDDELLRAALQPSWPDAKTATFTRSEKDGKLTVMVAKKAGTKGALVDRLLAAPNAINPAVAMSQRIQELQASGKLTPEVISEMLPKIEAAADQGERDLEGAIHATRDLAGAPAIGSESIPVGF